jgi:hypothetical protein
MKVLVLATAIGSCLFPAGGATRWIQNSGAPPRVGVFLDFEQHASLQTIRAMQREVTTILGATGAEFTWLALNRDTQAETFDELAVLRFDGSCEAPEASAGDAPHGMALGSTEMSDGEVSPYSSIQCDKLARCLRPALGEPGAGSEALFARALGRVVAHELYHILAKTREHTRTGVTAAFQTPYDLLRDHCRLDRKALVALGERMRTQKSGAAFAAQRMWDGPPGPRPAPRPALGSRQSLR